jgi:hypothetical protein
MHVYDAAVVSAPVSTSTAFLVEAMGTGILVFVILH